MARRKAAVVAAVQQGLISREEACRRYELSEEEFSSWQRSFETHGINGLRVTHLQQYRGASSSRLATAAPTAAIAARQKGPARRWRDCPRMPARELRVPERV